MASFSNGQQGTRGLSAGDWIRLRRLQGARTYTSTVSSNIDIINPVSMPRTIYSPAFLIPRDVGTSKIRRPASNWTDYVASQTADFVTHAGGNGITSNANTLSVTKLCSCVTSTLGTRTTGCKVCSSTPVHNRIQ